MTTARAGLMLAMAVALIFVRPDQSEASQSSCLHLAGSSEVFISPHDPSRQLVTGLLQWIDNHSSYDVSDSVRSPPEIVFCTTGTIIKYEGQDMVVDQDLRAAYDLDRRRIYLVRPWNPSNLEHRSVLLHELIHHLQFASRSWDCLQQPEYEAYRLQAAWMSEHGLVPSFDLAQIFVRSRCPASHH